MDCMFWSHIYCNIYKIPFFDVVCKKKDEAECKMADDTKVINGLCWAGPFLAIGLFPSAYQYFILLGIGMGNLSTFILMKTINKLNNKEAAYCRFDFVDIYPVGCWTRYFVLFSTERYCSLTLEGVNCCCIRNRRNLCLFF